MLFCLNSCDYFLSSAKPKLLSFTFDIYFHTDSFLYTYNIIFIFLSLRILSRFDPLICSIPYVSNVYQINCIPVRDDRDYITSTVGLCGRS